MKYISQNSQFNQGKSDNKTLFFGRNGDSIPGEDSMRIPHYAKLVEKVDSGVKTYFVRTHNSTLLDPSGPYAKRERNLDTKMQRVSKNTFDFYMTYLKTNNSIYMTKAQRGFLND